LPPGYYQVQACAVYNNETTFDDWEDAETWIQTFRIFGTRIILGQNDFPNSRGSILVLFSLLGILLVSVVAFGTTFFWYRRKRRATLKILKAEVARNRLSSSGSNKEEKWEIERHMLLINETDKLGAGAFGDVFKG